MPVIISPGSGAKLLIFSFPAWVIIPERDQCRATNRYSIGAKCHTFCHIRTIAHAARHNQLHFTVHIKVLQGTHSLADTGQNGLSDMFDKHILRCRGAALHTVQHNNIGTGLDRQCGIEIRARPTHFDIDRHTPSGDFTQFKDFNFQIIRPGPVRMTTGRPLVNAFWQVTHLCHAIRNFLSQQHAAATGLCPLANDDFNGVSLAQIIRIHAIARWQILIDKLAGMTAFLDRHTAITCCG